MIVVEDEAMLEREAKKRNVALARDAEGNVMQTGFFMTKTKEIVVSKEMAAKYKEGNTAAHELLHKVVEKTLYGVDGEGNVKGKNVARGLVQALDSELDKLDPAKVKKSKWANKLELYKKDPAAIRAEEKIVLLADAIESGDIKFNDGIFTKIGDQVRRFLQAVGLKDVKFNNGRDVYNFLKDYNASVKKGKLNKAQIKMMEEGAEVGGDIRRFQGTEGKLGKADITKQNKILADSYDRTNELLADEDFDIENSLDQKRAVIEAAGVIEATTNRLWRKGSLLTRPQFKKALENEYIQSLTEYDVARARQVPDTQEKDFDQKVDEGPKQRKKTYVSENQVIYDNVTPEARNQIKEEAKSTIGTLASKGKTPSEIVKALDTEAKKKYF